MKYTKPALSFEQQADQLLSRGFEADRARLIETLSQVSYYRLTAYWHPFKRTDDTFAPGTSLDKIWRRYTFDRQLRLLVMDAIERVEVARRSSRTGQVHPIGGFVGEAEYVGELGEFVPYLKAGKWVGVGRQTVWGKGEISIVTQFGFGGRPSWPQPPFRAAKAG